MTSLLDFPDLARKTLLDRLPAQDILKLRRVCSTTKDWVAEYLPPQCVIRYSKEKKNVAHFDPLTHFANGTFFIIDGIKTTFESLLSFELRTFCICIDNGIMKVGAIEPYDDLKFRDVYTPGPAFDLCITRNFPFVKKVTLNHFHANIPPVEWQFFCSLTSMDWLDIGTLWIDEVPTEDKPLRFPPTFKNLNYLHLAELRLTKEVFEESPDMRTYHWKLLSFCSKTEYIARPFVMYGSGNQLEDYREFRDDDGPPGPFEEEGMIGWLKQIVSERTDKQNRVREIDMCCMYDDAPIGTAPRKYFTTLMTFCGQRNIKLINVHSHLFSCHNPFDFEFLEKKRLMEESVTQEDKIKFMGQTVVSLINLTNYMNPHVLSGVERIGIMSMYKTAGWLNQLNPRDAYGHGIDRSAYISPPPMFPNLKDILITLDIDTEKYAAQTWDHFLVGLFSIPRPEVTRLNISFKRMTAEEGQGDGFCRTLTDPKFLRPAWLCNNFQAVTKLTLTGWDAKNIQFLQIWKALTNLEGVSINDCRTLGNVGFIGEDPYDPVFLKLTKMKRFILVVTNMPKITDRVFKDVFSKMKLVDFYLISENETPLENITSEGIRALADRDSEFSKSVRTFPFRFKLAGVTPDELEDLKQLFRCHQ